MTITSLTISSYAGCFSLRDLMTINSWYPLTPGAYSSATWWLSHHNIISRRVLILPRPDDNHIMKSSHTGCLFFRDLMTITSWYPLTPGASPSATWWLSHHNILSRRVLILPQPDDNHIIISSHAGCLFFCDLMTITSWYPLTPGAYSSATWWQSHHNILSRRVLILPRPDDNHIIISSHAGCLFFRDLMTITS